MKPCKSVQETSEEVLFIKARQIDIYRGLMFMLDSCSTETISIENYKIQISRSVFTHIQVYLCRVYFLTTLDIYTDYFKGRLKWCEVIIHAYCDQRQFALVYLFFEEATAFLRKGFCNQGASWSSSLDKVKNFAANIFLKLVC